MTTYRHIEVLLAIALLTACSKPYYDDDVGVGDGNVTLRFLADATRASVADYFTKLNVQLFAQDGSKVFDKVKTQQAGDANFGMMNMELSEGTYTVVAVGHSSTISATIKSPTSVQFTASDGEKLTDTFCYCEPLIFNGSAITQDCLMQRATAMVRFVFTDEETPDNVVRMRFDYTGGSANFNPTTLQGITKSTQSEARTLSDEYRIYTFPYLSDSGTLKITANALSADGSTVKQRVFENVPVTRNRITTLQGTFFADSDFNTTQSQIGFSVNGEWDGEDVYEF